MDNHKKSNLKVFFKLLFFITVTGMGLEPIRLATPPPQDGESTNSSTRPCEWVNIILFLFSFIKKSLKN